jgi:hypothetical protein
MTGMASVVQRFGQAARWRRDKGFGEQSFLRDVRTDLLTCSYRLEGCEASSHVQEGLPCQHSQSVCK